MYRWMADATRLSNVFFPFLGDSLVWALEQTLGREMTDDRKEAWNRVYDAISEEIMKAILIS